MKKEDICNHQWVAVEWETTQWEYDVGLVMEQTATKLYCPNCETYKEIKPQ